MAVLEKCLVLMVLGCMALPVWSQSMDIGPYRDMIRDKHNQIRREVRDAANMRELEWSQSLASQALEWARKCDYRRPPVSYLVGSNVFAETEKVDSFGDERRAVRRALEEWSLEAPVYVYSRECSSSRSCSYAQMIMADSDKIGCGMSPCSSLVVRGQRYYDVSLVVCFYAPPSSLMNGFPYEKGPRCSRCPTSYCNNDLCSGQAYNRPPAYTATTLAPPPIYPPSDKIPESERQYILSVHNTMRSRSADLMDRLSWSDYLADWAEYVIRCNIEYPGPRDTYTNFGRCSLRDPLHKIVYDWGSEGEDVFTKRRTSCRTPNNFKMCNHNTVMMEPRLYRMGCATRVCGSERQLTCIYDDVPPAFGGRELAAYTRSRPAYTDYRRYPRDPRRRNRHRRYHY